MAQRLLFGLVTLVFVFPSIATALGLGPIEVRSALNEPLNARIPVRAEPTEVESLRAELASAEAFSAAGLDRPYELSEMRFEVVAEGSGAPYVRVTTGEPVREPFIAFLADVRWSGGRLRREYTLFLDPPVYSERRDAVADAPSRTEPLAPAAQAPRAAAPEPRRSTPDTYQVRQGQTAWQVANAVRDPDFSVHQTMMALLQANPDAFIGGNVNNLRAGVTLQVPTREQLSALSDGEARRQFSQQTEAWESGRQPAPEETPAVAEADEPVREDDEDDVDEPDVAAIDDDDDEPPVDDEEVAADEEVTDEDAVAATDTDVAEDPDARLQLRGAADLAGDDAAQALLEDDLEATRDNVRLLQDQLVAMRTSEAALRSENEELRQMTDEMRARLDALERAVNLQADPGMASPDDPAPLSDPAESPAEGGVADEDREDRATEAELAAAPEESDDEIAAVAGDEPGATAGDGVEASPAIPAEDPMVQPERSSLEAMLADPRLQYMGSGALLLLLLLVLLMVRRRRQQRELEEAEYQRIHSPLPASAVIGANAAGKGADAFAADEALVSRSPLDAADAALADGDITAAREIINRGLILEPGNQALRLRLLRLHAQEQDVPAFEAEAGTLHRQLQDERDPIWQEVKSLAVAIGSAHALFGASGASQAQAQPVETPDQLEESGDEDAPEVTQPEPLQPGAESDDQRELAGDLDFDLDKEVERALDDGVPGTDDGTAEIPDGAAAAPGSASRAPEDADAQDDDWALDFELDVDETASGDDAAAASDETAGIDDTGLDFAVTDADADDGDVDDLLPMDEDGFESDPARPIATDTQDPTQVEQDDSLVNESATKLDLAQAYLDMGDADGARALLEEVLDEGSDDQKAQAHALMERAAGGS